MDLVLKSSRYDMTIIPQGVSAVHEINTSFDGMMISDALLLLEGYPPFRLLKVLYLLCLWDDTETGRPGKDREKREGKPPDRPCSTQPPYSSVGYHSSPGKRILVGRWPLIWPISSFGIAGFTGNAYIIRKQNTENNVKKGHG